MRIVCVLICNYWVEAFFKFAVVLFQTDYMVASWVGE